MCDDRQQAASLSADSPFLFFRCLRHNTSLRRERLPDVTASVTGRISGSEWCLLQSDPQVPEGPVVVVYQVVLRAALGRPPPRVELGGVDVAREMDPVEQIRQVRMVYFHALHGGVQLVVAFGFGEPSLRFLLGLVIAFAHVLLLPSSGGP